MQLLRKNTNYCDQRRAFLWSGPCRDAYPETYLIKWKPKSQNAQLISLWLASAMPSFGYTEIKGFGVRCRRSGAKYYFIKMRVGGRQRWLAIGRHGSPWTPDTARAEALRLLGVRANGRDPAKERDRRKVGATVAELGQRFLNEYVAKHCKPRTADEYRRAVEQCISPVLGRRISDLSRADVAMLHHKLRDRPYQANRSLAVLIENDEFGRAMGSATGRKATQRDT